MINQTLTIASHAPPMLAFEASRMSLMEKPRPLPARTKSPKWPPMATKEKRKRTGAVLMTKATLAEAPMVA